MQPGVGEGATQRLFGIRQVLLAGRFCHLYTSLARLLGKVPYVQTAVLAASPSSATGTHFARHECARRLLDELAQRPDFFARQEHAQRYSAQTNGQTRSHAGG